MGIASIPPVKLVATCCVSLFIALPFMQGRGLLGGSVPPQRQLRTYSLHGNPKSADISPDENLVVVETTNKANDSDPAPKVVREAVQIWNFKKDSLIAEFIAPQGDGETLPNTTRIVRFSPDGNFVVAMIGRTIHVLNPVDLTELRSIPLVSPGNSSIVFHGKSVTLKPAVRELEISPDSKAVAVLWVTATHFGKIDVYGLQSGRVLQSLDFPQAWTLAWSRMLWHPDGKSLVISVPEAGSCTSLDSEPDVFTIDIQTAAIKAELTTGLRVADIAIGPDNRLFAVDGSCLGVFENHDPKLKIFDLTTGQRLLDLSGRGAGVRYRVSTSANGNRLLAFTGKIKAKFDWGDLDANERVIDETFSVWNLRNYDGIVTSQNVPGLRSSGLRLSASGTYALSFGKASFVYELP